MIPTIDNFLLEDLIPLIPKIIEATANGNGGKIKKIVSQERMAQHKAAIAK